MPILVRSFFGRAKVKASSNLNRKFSPTKEDKIFDLITRSFDDIMEEKMNKIGKSWKNPAKRIKLVKTPIAEKPVFEG